MDRCRNSVSRCVKSLGNRSRTLGRSSNRLVRRRSMVGKGRTKNGRLDGNEVGVEPVVAVGGLGDLETKLSGNVFGSVNSVEVLAEQELETTGTTLTSDNNRRSQKVFPDSEPFLAVLGNDLFAVAHPVAVPEPKSGRVVDTNVVERNDFKASTFKLVDDPANRSGSIGTRENVLVHEETPDQVFVLP